MIIFGWISIILILGAIFTALLVDFIIIFGILFFIIDQSGFSTWVERRDKEKQRKKLWIVK